MHGTYPNRLLGSSGLLLKTGTILALGVLCASFCFAGDGGEIRVNQPLKRGQKLCGLKVKYLGWGWAGSGYREVQLQIDSSPPAKKARTVEVQVAPNSYSRSYTPLVVSKSVFLPAGHVGSTVSLLIPQQQYWQGVRVDILEDGRRIDELSMDNWANMQNRSGVRFSTEAFPTMLFIDSDAPRLANQDNLIADLKVNKKKQDTYNLPDVRSLSVMVHPDYSGGEGIRPLQKLILDPEESLERGTDLENLEHVQSLNQWEFVNPLDIPESWLGLTSADVMFVSLDDLNKLSVRHTRKLEILLTHISTGPVLVVHGLGDTFSRRDELDRILFPQTDPSITSQSTQWQPVEQDTRNESDKMMLEMLDVVFQQNDFSFQSYDIDESKSAIEKNPAIQPSVQTMFQVVDYGWGKVIAVEGNDPFHGKSQHWHWLFSQIDSSHWSWYQRHGMSQQRRNRDFWNFLIPSIGAAPVKSFLLMITAFAVVMGPLNYWVLRKGKKLYLLLATVPLGAAVLTIGLLVFVVLQDGLDTRLRCRSFTKLDRQAGTAVSWSRQSYYSGLALAGGLNYPADAAVYPLRFRSEQYLNQRQRRRLRWEGSDQLLQSGYHRSRSLSQYLVIHPQENSMALTVRQGIQTGDLEIENRLGVPLEWILLSDQNQQLHLAVGVPPGARVKTSVLDSSGKTAASALFDETKPSFPKDFDVDYHTRKFAFRNYYGWSGDSGFPDAEQKSSLLEKNLEAAQLDELPPPQSFLAVSRTAPGSVPLGIDDVEEVASLHVIEGTW